MAIVTTTSDEIVVRVLDARGVPPTDLAAESFQIRVGDAAPITPREALPTADPDASLIIAFIVDASGSMRGAPLDDVRQGLTDALTQLTSADRIALIAASGTIDVEAIDPTRDVNFDADRATFLAALDALEAGGKSPLYDATYKSVRLLAAQSASRTDTRRAVFILTDGNHSVPPRNGTFNDDSAIIAANQAGIPIFSFAIGRQREVAYLRRLAELSGGSFSTVYSSGQLADEIKDALTRLRTQYTLRFDPNTLPAGTQITVTLSHQSLQMEASSSIASAPASALTAAPTASASESTQSDISPGSDTKPIRINRISLSVTELLVIAAIGALLIFCALRVLRKPGAGNSVTVRTCRRCGHRAISSTTCPVCGAALS